MHLVALLQFAQFLAFSQPALAVSNLPTEDYPMAASAAEFGDPIPGLTEAESDLHIRGRRLFRWELWRPDRLSSGYNETECSKCHLEPYFGGSNKDPKTFVALLPDTEDRTGMRVYHRLQRNESRRFVQPERPTDAFLRRAPALFGLGLLEGVPAAELQKMEDPTDKNHDGISGRALVFGNSPAKFGWKPNFPTIESFVVQAFKGELGLHVESYDREDFAGGLSASQIKAVTFYVKTLGPPPRSPLTKNALEGKKIFTDLSCQKCHTPTLRTEDSTVAPLNRKTFEAYTDLLTHQIEPKGELHSVQDRYELGEYRTSPLWGLEKFGGPYWHDGSAPTILSAILKHDGEAKASRQAFESLKEKDQKLLLEFLQAL